MSVIDNPVVNPNIRIPNLPMGKIADEDGDATAEEKTFRQTLITSLQNNFGAEGCVIPTQSAADIATIQGNKYLDTATQETVYTCQYGTMLYNSDANSIMIAINDGTGKPVFKTVTLT